MLIIHLNFNSLFIIQTSFLFCCVNHNTHTLLATCLKSVFRRRQEGTVEKGKEENGLLLIIAKVWNCTILKGWEWLTKRVAMNLNGSYKPNKRYLFNVLQYIMYFHHIYSLTYSSQQPPGAVSTWISVQNSNTDHFRLREIAWLVQVLTAIRLVKLWLRYRWALPSSLLFIKYHCTSCKSEISLCNWKNRTKGWSFT